MPPAVRVGAHGEKPAAPGAVCGIKERGRGRGKRRERRRGRRRRGQGAGERPPLVASAGCGEKTWAIEECVSFQ